MPALLLVHAHAKHAATRRAGLQAMCAVLPVLVGEGGGAELRLLLAAHRVKVPGAEEGKEVRHYDSFLAALALLLARHCPHRSSDYLSAATLLLQDQWPSVQANAAVLLVSVAAGPQAGGRAARTEQVARALAGLLHEPHEHVRIRAAQALGLLAESM